MIGSNEKEGPDVTTGELQLEGKAKNVNSKHFAKGIYVVISVFSMRASGSVELWCKHVYSAC